MRERFPTSAPKIIAFDADVLAFLPITTLLTAPVRTCELLPIATP